MGIIATTTNDNNSLTTTVTSNATTIPPPSLVGDGGCSVCGEGKEVKNPDSIYNIPGQQAVSCRILEDMGKEGTLEEECSLLLESIETICDCQPITTSRTTNVPTAMIATTIATTPCSVCGDGKEVNDLNAIFSFPGEQSVISCGILQDTGRKGLIPSDQCTYLPILINTLCDCQPKMNDDNDINGPTDGCSICGNGQIVINLDGIFAFPGQPAVTCRTLELAGEQGLIPIDQCLYLPSVIRSICNCQPIIDNNAPTTPPTTDAPTAITRMLNSCSVCGDGKKVGNPEGIISFPGQPKTTCGNLENDGEQGIIPIDQCAFFPELIGNLCNCISSVSPVTTAPSPNPILTYEPSAVLFPSSVVPTTTTTGALTNTPTSKIISNSPSVLPTNISNGMPSDSLQKGCSVCGEGKSANNPDAIFTFPGQPSVPCGILEQSGKEGLIPLDQCSFISTLVTSVCDCQSIVVLPTNAPTKVNPSCSVCGEGKSVTKLEAMFSLPGQPSVPCGTLEDNGEQGLIPADQCEIYPEIITGLCDCKSTSGDILTKMPTTLPTNACSVCGVGNEVNNPTAVFSFPGQAPIECGRLEDEGDQGILPEDQCNILPEILASLCDCQPIGPSAAPITNVPTSNSPTALNGCSICGEGKKVNEPDAIFAFPGQPSVPCGTLEDNGKQGLIPEDECSLFSRLIMDLCDCKSSINVPNEMPTPPSNACSICGEGKEVNAPNAIYSFPGQPPVECGKLEDEGEQGLLPEDQCIILPTVITSLSNFKISTCHCTLIW